MSRRCCAYPLVDAPPPCAPGSCPCSRAGHAHRRVRPLASPRRGPALRGAIEPDLIDTSVAPGRTCGAHAWQTRHVGSSDGPCRTGGLRGRWTARSTQHVQRRPLSCRTPPQLRRRCSNADCNAGYWAKFLVAQWEPRTAAALSTALSHIYGLALSPTRPAPTLLERKTNENSRVRDLVHVDTTPSYVHFALRSRTRFGSCMIGIVGHLCRFTAAAAQTAQPAAMHMPQRSWLEVGH